MRFCYFVCLLWVIMTLAGCAEWLTTEHGARTAFTKLPFANSDLIALRVRENSGQECYSVNIHAIYHDSRPFGEVLDSLEAILLNDGWEQESGYASSHYRGGTTTTLSVRTKVGPNLDGLPKGEGFDYKHLSLPKDKPIDNLKDDGYFTVVFYYHPFPPNQCSG